MSILNPAWHYTPAANTNVRATWERHGFRATSQAQRNAAQKKLAKRYRDTRQRGSESRSAG